MISFARAVAFVLAQEGGYSNDPNDPGGETRYGISKRRYPAEDIRNLTVERARELYRRDYWDKNRCGELPAHMALCVFDAAVNGGAPVRWLQMAVGASIDFALIADALAAMPDDPNLIWVTGPSKTADVEGILIQGVHGPGAQACLIL